MFCPCTLPLPVLSHRWLPAFRILSHPMPSYSWSQRGLGGCDLLVMETLVLKRMYNTFTQTCMKSWTLTQSCKGMVQDTRIGWVSFQPWAEEEEVEAGGSTQGKAALEKEVQNWSKVKGHRGSGVQAEAAKRSRKMCVSENNPGVGTSWSSEKNGERRGRAYTDFSVLLNIALGLDISLFFSFGK